LAACPSDLLLSVGSLLACARYGNITLFSLNQSARLFIINLRLSLEATFVGLLHSNKNEHFVAVNVICLLPPEVLTVSLMAAITNLRV
jgi:hypothetical protein